MKAQTFNKIFQLIVLLAIVGLIFLGVYKVADKGDVDHYIHLLLSVLVALGAGSAMMGKKKNGENNDPKK